MPRMTVSHESGTSKKHARNNLTINIPSPPGLIYAHILDVSRISPLPPESNCVKNQVNFPWLGFHSVLFLSMELATINSFLIQATRATFLVFPFIKSRL